jgi:5-methylthioadenosine/S-adenosylhomocysteine deaminase
VLRLRIMPTSNEITLRLFARRFRRRGTFYAQLLGVAFLLGACSDPFEDLPDGGSPDGAVSDGVQAEGGTEPFGEGAILLRGTVVTPDGVLKSGEVLVNGDEIVCVAESCADKSDASTAIVETGGIIFPGLIDAHNHTEYNYQPVWQNPKLYDNHGQWQGSSAYSKAISGAHSEMKSPDGTDGKGLCQVAEDCSTGICTDNKCQNLLCEMIKYGEIRSLISGTTMISQTVLRKCANTLIRNADLPYHGLDGGDSVRTNTLGVYSISNASSLISAINSGDVGAYVIHVSEGIDEKAREEFDALEAQGLLLPQVVLVHGTALNEADLDKVKAANMRMVWSPSSNMALYGQTNKIDEVWQRGIPFALAPDWTPSGAANVLQELRFAKKYSDENLNGLWTAKDLVAMVTSKAAQVLGFDSQLGSLKVGMKADILVVSGDSEAPYDALIATTLADVRLVITRGRALYGNADLIANIRPNAYCESMTVCESSKLICVKESESDENQLDQTLTDIENVLNRGYEPGIHTLETCD